MQKSIVFITLIPFSSKKGTSCFLPCFSTSRKRVSEYVCLGISIWSIKTCRELWIERTQFGGDSKSTPLFQWLKADGTITEMTKCVQIPVFSWQCLKLIYTIVMVLMLNAIHFGIQRFSPNQTFETAYIDPIKMLISTEQNHSQLLPQHCYLIIARDLYRLLGAHLLERGYLFESVIY